MLLLKWVSFFIQATEKETLNAYVNEFLNVHGMVLMDGKN